MKINKIKEAALKYASTSEEKTNKTNNDKIDSFIKGAISKEAKEYWFEKFKNNYLNPKNVTRIEIINHNSPSENYGIGRVFTHYDVKSCELCFQDDKKTLKIFI